MIDEQWFAIVRCISGTEMSDEAAGRLVDVLGVQEEVLPYLLLRTNGFAEWPQARSAFRQAVRSVVRPRLSARPAPAHERRAPVYAEFSAATVERMQGASADPHAVALLCKARLAGAASTKDPHVFIASANSEDGQ